MDRAQDMQRIADLTAQCCAYEMQLTDARNQCSTAKVRGCSNRLALLILSMLQLFKLSIC